jgi:two-component system cell cycle sensor histidine kinase PleC
MSEQERSPREDNARPPDPDRRRRHANDLREARHSPSASVSLNRSIEHDLARAYAKNVLKTSPHYLILAAAILSTASLWQPLGTLLPGILALIVAITAIDAACRRFIRQSDISSSLRTWRVGFLVADLALGASWLAVLSPFLGIQTDGEPTSSTSYPFVLLVSAIVSGATAILRAPLPTSVYAGVVPLTVAVLISAMQSAEIEIIALALIALSSQLFMLYFAKRLYRVAVAFLRAQGELRANIAELEQIKANTTHARQRAEEAERAKAQFLATISHELRTPLNAILGFSEVMKNEVLGSHSTPSYRQYSSDIHGSGQLLLALINEILELSRIESGRYELNEESIRLGDLVASALESAIEQAKTKDQTIKVTVDPTLEALSADARAVRQILLNLLSNATKFTPAGGHIAVKAGWTSRGGQYVTITDNGPGIPDEEIPVALSSFGRGSLAASMAAQGAGLGLPIAKGLTDLHGGRFVLRSKLGGGTEATVIFPASRGVAARGSAQTAPGAAAA